MLWAVCSFFSLSFLLSFSSTSDITACQWDHALCITTIRHSLVLANITFSEKRRCVWASFQLLPTVSPATPYSTIPSFLDFLLAHTFPRIIKTATYKEHVFHFLISWFPIVDLYRSTSPTTTLLHLIFCQRISHTVNSTWHLTTSKHSMAARRSVFSMIWRIPE